MGGRRRRASLNWPRKPTAACRPCRWNGAGPRAPVSVVSDIRPSNQAELDLSDVLSSLRSEMWHNAGIERTGAHLTDTGEMIDFWARYTLDKIFDEPRGWEVQNMLLIGWLIARSAAGRAESRGCHWRTDAAGPADPAVHDVWRRGAGEPALEPVRTGVLA